ncbi:uncharacterized protein LOC110821222 isoform X2 [Carica papaya]|nr:uncharacterized protein LOC110821222 isoform X2 [Carica papaya]
MVNKDGIDFFLNFPRKELQNLCKKYGLPANRSSTDMAISLKSFYEKKSSSPMSLDGGLGAVQEVSGPTSLVPLLQSGAPLDSTGDTRRDEHIGRSCSPTKKFHSMGETAYDKVCFCLCPFISVLHSDHKAHKKVSMSIQETICGPMQPLLVPQSDGVNLNDKENPTLTSGENNLGIGRDCKLEEKPRTVDTDINDGGCPKESVPLRPSRATRLPEFEFYVSSENGINLCVDLNFNPSDWIKKLTSEISLPDNIQSKNHRSFHREIGCSAESNEQVKNPLQQNLEVCQSNKGNVLKESARNPTLGEKNNRSFDQEIGCFVGNNEQVKNPLQWNSDVCQSNNDHILKESARNPIISENTHLPSDHPDKVERSFLSSIGQCNKIIGVVENFEEKDGLNNLSIPQSAASHQIVSHTESCSKDIFKITSDSVVNSPQKQLAVGSVVNMADGSINLNTLVHQGRKLPIEICENSFLPDACEHSCTISSPGGGCVKMPSSEVEICSNNASLLPCEYVKPVALVDTDAEQDELANATVSSHETYRRCFPSFPEEQEMNKVDSGRELSECCQHDSLEETFVGLDGVESNEILRKRSHIDGEDQNSCDEPKTKIMRSATPVSNQVTPRRSVRLVSQ